MIVPIQSVEVTYLVHDTEDTERVVASVQKQIEVAARPELEELEGHFGNRISRARLRLTGEEASRALLNAVAKMPQPVKEEIAAGLGSYLDEHSALFLRFDKQMLVSGSLALAGADPIRLKVKPRAFMMKDGAPDFFLRILGGR